MKRLLIVAMMVAGIATFAGDEQQANGDFMQVNGDFKDTKMGLPIGWYQNKGHHLEPLGEIDVTDGAVILTSDKKPTYLYTGKAFPATNGDKFEITFKYKSGKGGCGLYMYTENGWAGMTSKSFDKKDDWTDAKFLLTVSGTALKVAKIRFMIFSDAESKVYFKDLKVKKL